MSERKLGPREQQLRDMREANYKRMKAARPSVTELRQTVAKVSPKKRSKGGRRGRKA